MIINTAGTKFKTHLFKSSENKNIAYRMKKCEKCGLVIYYSLKHGSSKLTENAFSAIGMSLNDNISYQFYKDILISCDEYIIKNIIE